MVTKMAVDKVGLETYLKEIGKRKEKEQVQWLQGLTGITPYEKLLNLTKSFNKPVSLCERSKRWWDKELSAQLQSVC